MSDFKEASSTPTEIDEQQAQTTPSGWMYRQRKLGPFTTPFFASPEIQLYMVSFVCFLCPGMFNALGGLGGGGKADATLADNMNIALYATFAFVGFFAGTFVNRLGVRLTLAFGGLGYCIYAISLLASEHAYVGGFNIFAGALLGVCAGLLWTAQGTIMLSYPLEHQKGRAFAWFWGIFNLGAVIGSLIPLIENLGVTTNSTVSDGTYIAFIVLMFIGAVLALFLCNADKVIRSDGSRVVLMKNPSWKSEFIGLYETLRYEPFILLLFPMFWSSNWFYAYQFNAVNGAYFDTRTKSLNGLLYWLAQIIGAFIFGWALDATYFSRTVRAKLALGGLFALTMVIWGGGYAWQTGYTRATVADKGFVFGDWTDSNYGGPLALFMAYGFFDAAWQCCTYWFIGALSNSGRKSANFVGFYKGIQSAGAAVMWYLDSSKTSFMNELLSNWILLAGSLVIAAPVIFMKIQDHVSVEEDLQGTNETLDNVLPSEKEKRMSV